MIITAAILKKIEPKAKAAVINDLAKYLAPALDAAGINTPNRVAHFLAQAAHESDGFKTLAEYWGPTAAQSRYEGRADLGNTVKGDGSLFRGRGIFQITGRSNYTTIGKALGLDLITDPTVASTGEISVKTAIYYWNSRKLSVLADNDDVKGITKKINGGYNGLDDRIARLAKVRTVIAEIFSADTPDHPVTDATPAPVTPTPDTTPFLVFAKLGMNNEMVKIIQVALNHKGYILKIDGDYGKLTEAAVTDFQKKNKLTVDGIVGPETYTAILKV
jgi:putative chitinase